MNTMQDLRIVELQERQGMAFGVQQIVSTLVAGSILVMIGLYTYSKVSGSIDQSGFTASENTTLTNVRTNVTSGFDLSSILFIVVAAVGIVGAVMLAFK